jgi:hypothetical protein
MNVGMGNRDSDAKRAYLIMSVYKPGLPAKCHASDVP